MVDESGGSHLRGEIEVASVDDDGVLQFFADEVEVEVGELFPIGEDEEGVGAVEGGVAVIGEADTGGEFGIGEGARVGHGGGIVGGDEAAFGEEHVDDGHGGGFADVVGAALEGESEDGEAFAFEGPEGGADFAQEAFALVFVDGADLVEEAEVVTVLGGDGAEGGDIFREATAAVAESGFQEAGADAGVAAEALTDLFDIGIDGFADIGDGVDERDLEGEEGVGGVLDKFGALGGGFDERDGGGGGMGAGDGVLPAVVGAGGEGKIDLAEEVAGALGVGADDDAIGIEEVGDGGAFAKELGVGDDLELVFSAAVEQDDATDPFVGVHGNGAFFDDDFEAVESAGDLAGDGLDVGEIGFSGGGGGSADGDEDGGGGGDGGVEVSGEGEAGGGVFAQEFGEELFVDGAVAVAQELELALVVIDQDDLMAEFGERSGGDEADVA